MSKSTMREVAEYANVSVSTVSHVINNSRFVSEETRQKVLEAIEILHYNPDAMARFLKTGKKKMIGFIAPDIANDYFVTITDSIEDVLDKKGYNLIISKTKENPDKELEAIKTLSGGIVDGIIIASACKSYKPIASIVPPDFPMIFLDREITDCPHDLITISNYHALTEGIDHLIESGHSKIGMLTGSADLSSSKDRVSAFVDCLNNHHLHINDDFIQYSNSVSRSIDQQMDAILNAGCTALIIANNVMENQALLYLSKAGIHIGSDFQLLGCQDGKYNNYFTHFFHSIIQPTEEMGRLAGQRILRRIDVPACPVQHIVLQSTIRFSSSKVSIQTEA